jgi:exonuclease VII large subunit
LIFTLAVAIGLQYHAIKVGEFAKRRLTHVCTTGVVTYIKHEDDNDWHYRVEDGPNFIVAEVTQETPLPSPFKPKKGDHVTVCGTRRYDDAPGHAWWEVHPVEIGTIDNGQHTK